MTATAASGVSARGAKRDFGTKIIVASENSDDRDTIPLYEQIYALAGLAQYYRITQDWEVLEDIQRTINSFQTYYLDSPENGFGGLGGYFSHIDYATLAAGCRGTGRQPVAEKLELHRRPHSCLSGQPHSGPGPATA